MRGDSGIIKRRSSSVSTQRMKSLSRLVPRIYQRQIGEFTTSTIPSMICESAFKCDRDQQAQLLGNAILCGGGSCLSTSVLSTATGVFDDNTMPERIRQECEAIIHEHTPNWRVKVLIPGISERAICSWLGASASILVSIAWGHSLIVDNKGRI